MRVWIPKPEYRGVVPKLSYTDEELVDFFLDTTHDWYENKDNMLYGWRDRIRDELIRCLRENDEANDPHQLIYAEMKFHQEWIGPRGMFTNEPSPWELGLNEAKATQ